MSALMHEAQPEANQAALPKDLPTALHAQHVVIQSLVINLYAAPGPGPFVQQAPAGADEGEADAENQD